MAKVDVSSVPDPVYAMTPGRGIRIARTIIDFGA